MYGLRKGGIELAGRIHEPPPLRRDALARLLVCGSHPRVEFGSEGEAQAALDWLAEKQGLQAAVDKTQDPVLLSADVDKKLAALERFSTPIMSKPKPKPPAPEPAPEPAKPEAEATGDANGEAAPMEEDGEGAPEAEGAPEVAPKADDLD